MLTQVDRRSKLPAWGRTAEPRFRGLRNSCRSIRAATLLTAALAVQSTWSSAALAQFTFSGYSDATFGVPSPNIPSRVYDLNYVDALGRPRRDTGIEIGEPSGAGSNNRFWRFSNATRQHGNLYELNSAAFNSVGVNAPFPIADLSYFNAETFTAGASVYNVPITTRLNLTSLIGAPTPQFDFNFRLTFTENTFGPVPDTLEFLNASSSQTFTYGTTTYALRLRGFSNDNGQTLQNTFSLPEYATVTSRLYGQLEVVEGPRLFVNYPGQMIFQARVGTTASQQLTVQNSGASNTSLVGYVQGVAAPSKFGPSDSLDFTLASGESLTRTYTYRPTSRTQGINDFQTVNVVSNASNGIEDVVLVGQGVGPVYFSSPAPNSTINMGRVMADAGSAAIPISNVTNDGALGSLTYLTLRNMTFSGTNGSEFRAWDVAPGTHIGPGDPARTLRVRLVSGQRGVKSARLTIDTDVNAAYEADGTDYGYNIAATAVEKRRINVDAIDYGRVMRGSTPTTTVNIAGDASPDNFYTNPTLLPGGGSDGTINVSADTQERPVNSSSGAVLSTRTVTASFPNAGLQDGFVPLQVRPEGLAGEGNYNVGVAWQATAVDDRVVSGTAVSFGKIFVNTPAAPRPATLTTEGEDDVFTRVTVKAGQHDGGDGTRIEVAADVVFDNPAATAQANISANFPTPGVRTAAASQLTVANGGVEGEGLAGENVSPVAIAYDAEVYSRGKPSFSATADQQSLTLNVGRMIAGGAPAAGSATFTLHNRSTSATTAAIEFDGVASGTGNTGQFSTGLPANFTGLQAGTSNTYTASLQAGATGQVSATYVLAFHDQRDVEGHADNDSLSLTLTASAVANRVITADPVTVGRVFAATPVSKPTTLRTTGDDAEFTRVVLNGGTYSAAPASVQVPAASTVFNSGTSTAAAIVNANFATPGSISGGVQLNAANGALVGEGLAGESVQPVNVAYNADVFSRGRPSFSNGGFSNALSFDFGQYNLGSSAAPFSFNLHNLLTAGGANFTGGIEVESISSTGDNTRFTLVTPSLGSLVSPGTPRAANASLSTTAAGNFSATYIIRFHDDRTIAGAAQSADELTLTLTGKVVNPVNPTPTRTNIFVINPGFEQIWPDPTAPTNIAIDPGKQTLGFGATFAPAGASGTLLPRFVPGWNSADELDDKSGVHRPTTSGPNAAFVAGGYAGQNVAYTDGDTFEQTVIGTFDPDETYELRFKVGRRDSGQFYAPDVSLLLGGTVFAPLSTDFPVPPAGGFIDWTATYRIAAADPLFGSPLTIRVTPDGRSRIGLDSFAIVIPGTGPEGPYDTEWGWSSGGEWSELPKWTYGIPNHPGSEAWFYDAISNPSTVVLDSDITVGAVRFDNAKRYTLAGPNKLRLDNAGAGPAELEVKAGSHVIAAPVEMFTSTQAIVANGGALTISGAISNPSGYALVKSGLGTLVLTGSQSHGAGATVTVTGGTLTLRTALGSTTSLSVEGSGSTASIEANQRLLSIALMTTGRAILVGDGRTLTVTQCSFGGGTLDVARGYAVFDYGAAEASPILSLINAINSGRAGGTWTGTGIVSSLAPLSPGAVGVAAVEASWLASRNPSLYASLGLDGTSVVVRATRMGDTDLDGVTNFNDLLILAARYNQSTQNGWRDSDFNGDGVVDFSDLLLIAANYNQSLAQLEALPLDGGWALAEVVPEPASLLVVATASCIALRRRRRLQR